MQNVHFEYMPVSNYDILNGIVINLKDKYKANICPNSAATTLSLQKSMQYS